LECETRSGCVGHACLGATSPPTQRVGAIADCQSTRSEWQRVLAGALSASVPSLLITLVVAARSPPTAGSLRASKRCGRRWARPSISALCSMAHRHGECWYPAPLMIHRCHELVNGRSYLRYAAIFLDVYAHFHVMHTSKFARD